MQTFTDNSNLNYSPAIFVGGSSPPLEREGKPLADEAVIPTGRSNSADSTTKPQGGLNTTAVPNPSAAQPVIDWNTCPPDGTEQSFSKVVSCVATVFHGDVTIGLRSDGGELELNGLRIIEEPTLRATLRSAVAEAVQSKQACLFAATSGQSSLVLKQLRQATDDALLLGFGVGSVVNEPAGLNAVDDDAFDVGVVVGIRRVEQLQSKEVYAALIAQTQLELRSWLQVWRRCRIGSKLSNWRKRFRFYRRRRGQVGLLIGGVLLASLAVPVPYWPQRQCLVEPASKSFLASPIDGRIRAATVRPGDLVKQGQVLAHLDEEQIRWQLSSAEAEYETASKKRDTALATRAGGELRLAQLDQERIAVQIESLERQLDRLELRSPIDGVVVQGDWFQSDGAPVSRGDMLFEIAAMDHMRVEIHLSTDDLARIEVGDQATIHVDAAPGVKWTAELNRIDPRGQVVDTEVVFAANLDVDNATNQLRPGMQGTARISAGTQSIGWLLFHRPTLWALKKLAW